ncbi:VirB4 family type IV secretion system protein [Ktedonospora formicarum]|uniref:CagE TrbE VirB component of type IV transporter system central domain-containing protein n=1 Tax=Ktedonospora formicarum TaxID=2778364 RepID=A0A8J3IBD3_9CHLR|nr:hypothetical protein [Ktedonospora formicarum]GHO49188.1 hypothetical protein KSX_73510 [Ktedonospora formicarum]
MHSIHRTHSSKEASHRHPFRQKHRWVQEDIIKARAIHQQILCLASETPGCFDYATVLQVEGICYDLKGEDEQHLINELYQAFLASLPYDIQILWRVLPLDIQQYGSQFTLSERATHTQGAAPIAETAQEPWHPVADDHATLLSHLGARRTLLERSLYLLLKIEGAPHRQVPVWQRWMHASHTRHSSQAEAFEQAKMELDVRVREVSRLLSNMGLAVKRLEGTRMLTRFYASCVLHARQSLPDEVIESVGRPIEASGWLAHHHGSSQTSAYFFEQDPTKAQRDASVSEQASPERHTQRTRKRPTPEPTVAGRDFTQLADLVAPAGIAIERDCLRLEDEYARVLVIHHLPRRVHAGWLKPLADLDEPLEVSFHIHPYPSAQMIAQFRRRQMEFESSLLASRKGTASDPHTQVAAADVASLLTKLASGEERMLDVSLHIVLRSASKRELNERTRRVLSILQNMQVVARPALFEQEQAFRSCLPHVRNHLKDAGMLLNSRSASAMFPFLSNALYHPTGILEGVTPARDLVTFDAWSHDIPNANRIVLGPPGWGKSHAVKNGVLRLALKYAVAQQQAEPEATNFQAIIIDPEGEYGYLSRLFGGSIIRLAPGSAQHLNPFDLPKPTRTHDKESQQEDHGDRLADHVQKLHSLLDIMLADHTPDGAGKVGAEEKGLLDRALFETYRRVGITSDVRTHDRQVPLMRDLYQVLESGVCGPDTTGLLQRLHRFVWGSLSGLFADQTNVNLDGRVLTFDIHDLETELRPVGLFLVSNFIWTQSYQSTIPRQLIIDEAATLMQYESGALFLEDFVRRARKHYIGVTVISQHPRIFAQSSIIANCAVHVLMRQDVSTLDLMSELFKLSSHEVQLLRRLGVGEALFLTNEKRLQLAFEASPLEHILASTNPRELAHWRADSKFQHIEQVIHLLQNDRAEPAQLHEALRTLVQSGLLDGEVHHA